MKIKALGHTFSIGRRAAGVQVPALSVDDLSTMGAFLEPLAALNSTSLTPFDGDKFVGGFGNTKVFITDYWLLRHRSAQLFEENLYARGLIRRLITNEINTGLNLEATPDTDILGLGDEFRNDWSESAERRFQIYSKNPRLCDFHHSDSFGALEKHSRQEALVCGDVLTILEQSPVTKLPQVRIVSGNLVQSPLGGKPPQSGHTIKHGVELDAKDRQVAYWVRQKNGQSKRIPAYGPRTGRRKAWLRYGSDKRADDVRGQPILALVMQSLKEIDRYRDSAQRKAVINSILAMFIKKGEDKMGTRPMGGGAKRKDMATVTDGDSTTRSFNLSSHIPGVILDELQTGEEPVGFNSAGTDINFPVFEAAIVNGFSWAFEVPPEILTLAFQNNYSASRAAVNEFKMYLNRARVDASENFNEIIYQEWLLSETLLGKILAPGLLEAWRDPRLYDIYGAWISSDWSGAIKPSVDLKKEVQGYEIMARLGWITNDRAARETTGTKFSTNIRRQGKENQLKAAAMRPLLELEKEFGLAPGSLVSAAANGDISADNIADIVGETIEQAN